MIEPGPTIKLITLNVEMNRHWDRIVPFLERESPDVLCLQELFDRDIKMLANRFGYQYVYIPTTKIAYDTGTAVLTRLPLKDVNSAYYYKPAPEIQTFRGATLVELRATVHEGIVWGAIEKDGARFTVASTHFTWTPDGKPNENQDRDIVSLFKILDGIPALILCGDLNAPRGDNRIYRSLIERFKDNIPADIETTLDMDLRKETDPVERARLRTYVVDYIFSTPEYAVSDVRRVCGLSDHCAIVANVSRQA